MFAVCREAATCTPTCPLCNQLTQWPCSKRGEGAGWPVPPNGSHTQHNCTLNSTILPAPARTPAPPPSAAVGDAAPLRRRCSQHRGVMRCSQNSINKGQKDTPHRDARKRQRRRRWLQPAGCVVSRPHGWHAVSAAGVPAVCGQALSSHGFEMNRSGQQAKTTAKYDAQETQLRTHT